MLTFLNIDKLWCQLTRQFLCMNKFGVRCGQCFSMCYMVTLFRYYVAEGVRIYCQQSWKMVVGTEGKQLVEKHITEIVSMHLLCGLLLWKGILSDCYCSNKIRFVGALQESHFIVSKPTKFLWCQKPFQFTVF